MGVKRFLVLAVTLAVVASGVTVSVPVSSFAADPDEGSGVSDSTSAPDAVSALTVAAAYDHPVVVDSQTTPVSQVSVLPDGTMQLTSNTVPVRVKQQGVWVPVDTTLKANSEGWFAPVASATPVQFSPGQSQELAKVQTSTGVWLTESWPLAALPTPKVSGSVALYENVLPDVNLQLRASASGMSEVLIIKTAKALSNPDLATIRLSMSGATVSTGAGKPVVATAPDGSTAVASAPLWWDSAAKGAGPDGPGFMDEARPVDHEASGSEIFVNIATSTQDSSPTFPIFVDPDWSVGVQQYWFDDRRFPNQTYLNGEWSDGHLSVGAGGPYLSHAFWEFDTSPLAGKHVLGAQFAFSLNGSFTCSERQFDLYHFGTTGAGFSWNNEPTGNWGGYLSSINLGCDYGWHGMDATSAVAYSVAVGMYPMQLGMRANDESDLLTRRHLDLNGSLTVRYNTPPNAPTSPTITSPPRACGTYSAPAYVNGAQPLTLQVSSSDPDSTNLSTRFFVVQGDDGSVNKLPPAVAPAGYLYTPFQAPGSASVQVPANTFKDGFYAWHANTSDGTDVGPVNGWCWFQVKSTPPVLPTISTLTAATTVGAPMVVRFSSPAADKVTTFAYWWSNAASATPAAVPPVMSGAAPPACDAAWSGVTYVCADAAGRSPVVTVAPVDDTSTLWVASYDQAGNVSSGPASAHSTGLTVIAAPDARVSYTTGHGWVMENLASPLGSSIADSNTMAGAGLSSRHDLTIGAGVIKTTTSAVVTGLPETPVLTFPGYATLARYTYGSKRRSAVNGDVLSASWRLEQFLGQMVPSTSLSDPTPAGMQRIYSCDDESFSLWSMSTSSGCEGWLRKGRPVGFVWTAAANVPAGQTAVAVYRCHDGMNRFESTSSSCEGKTLDYVLGYFAAFAPTQTTGPVLDTTKSFTVSAWLRPSITTTTGQNSVAVSASGPVNSGFTLGQHSGDYWQFCVQTQGATYRLDCARGATRVTPGRWTLVTGVWDATNHQIRLLLDQSIAPVAVATHLSPPDDVSANGALVVGSAVLRASPVSPWSGDIDDPTVFGGVVDEAQLQNLFNQSPP